MDLQKLIERQEKLVAEAQSMLAGSGAGGEAIQRPVELQQAQADRVLARIEGLKRSREELVRSIDAELKELESEHKARRRRIETDLKDLEAAAKDAQAARPPDGKKASSAASPKAAK